MIQSIQANGKTIGCTARAYCYTQICLSTAGILSMGIAMEKACYYRKMIAVIFDRKSGERYIGEFKEDAFHGKGSYIYINGAKFKGNYEKGKRSGSGSINLYSIFE